MVVGTVVAVLANAALLVQGNKPPLPMLLALPVVALISYFPLVLNRTAASIEIGFDSCVLVFLLLVTGPLEAVAVWALASLVGQLVSGKRVSSMAFNIGLSTLAGAAMAWTATALDPLREISPGSLLAIAVGCAAYFVVDYAVTGISVALEEGLPTWTVLAQPTVLLALAAFVAIDSLGYLAAVVVRDRAVWVWVLLGVPVATILIATRALSRGHEHGRRLASLFDAAASMQSLPNRPAILDSVRTHARRVLHEDRVELRDQPPGPGEVGAVVQAGETAMWMVGPTRNRARSSKAGDQQALEALAAVAVESLARADLVEEMAHVARHDALTGLANRRLFQDRVEHGWHLHRRHEWPIAVLFLDLDNFKPVNDRFGHEIGDELLVAVADRLRRGLRPGDTVARLGGDEFAVLLEQAGSPDDVRRACERILDQLHTEFRLSGRRIMVGASVGVALSRDADDADAMLRNADMAMYRAKAAGKGGHHVFEPELAAARLQRLELLEQLSGAVGRGEMVLHYQPVVRLGTGDLDGYEALLRWRGPDGLVGPNEFIGLAEESGLIGAIGEWVLEQACADLPQLVAAAGRSLTLGVNVSAHQLSDQHFVEQVARLRPLMDADSALMLEMTESVLIGDDEATLYGVQALHDVGARLAIDDFGTGYSSIGYLRRLPFDVLKVDRSFVSSMTVDHRALTLVEAIVSMSSALNLAVVAEGIEREDQADRLRALGCTSGQGYLFARPMPLGDAVRYARRGAMAQLSPST